MKVLFIGYGSIAKKHKTALDKLYPEAVCFALRSGTAIPAIEGVTSLYDWDHVPADIDFAIVANPTSMHTGTVHHLVEKKIAIFLEKPIADTLQGLDELADKIRQEKLSVYVACNLRFSPVLQFLHNQLQAQPKRINEVLVYAGSYLPEWRPGIDFRNNYSARADLGGGVHLDLFHELDYVSWLFGQPLTSSSTLRNVSSLGITAIDFASYTWEYKAFTATILLNYFRRKAKRTIEIVFEDDTWIIDILQSRITSDKGIIIYDQGPYDLKETYFTQMQYFTEMIRQHHSPELNTFENSLQTLKICLQKHETQR